MLQEFAKLRNLHALLGDAEQWLEEQLGVPICIPSCGICCTENTPTVHSLEASLIVSYLIGTGGLRYLEAARSWLLDRDIATVYEGIPYGAVPAQVKDEWARLTRSPCLFLTSDLRCAVHKMRPLPCRTFGVTRIGKCPRPLGKGETAIHRQYVGGRPANIIKEYARKVISEIKQANPDYARMGLLPTMIFRQAREKEFRDLIADNKIASAKLVGTDFSTQALWQDQLENLVRV